jgi:hypothetical protein
MAIWRRLESWLSWFPWYRRQAMTSIRSPLDLPLAGRISGSHTPLPPF